MLLGMTDTPAPTRRPWRFLLLFVSFPLAGLLVSLLFGRSLTPLQALAAGAILGLVIGVASAFALGTRMWTWALASAVGLGAGTAASVLLAPQAPLLAALIQGLALGIAQALVKPPFHPLAWAVLVLFAWFTAWAVSLQVAIGDEPGFVVFGASGALAFSAISWLAVSGRRAA